MDLSEYDLYWPIQTQIKQRLHYAAAAMHPEFLNWSPYGRSECIYSDLNNAKSRL